MAMSYKGGVISATAPTTSAGGAPGSWTLKQQMQAIGSSLWTGIPDAYYKYVSLLLPGNGTNGAQNNTFLDSSSNNFTITRNGNTTQGTFTPYGANWGNYFSGSSQYLSVSGGVTNAGTGDFTLEFWVFYTGSYANYEMVFDSRTSAGGFTNGFNVATDITTGYWYAGFSAQDLLTSIPVAKNQWSHIAVTRSGTTMRLFVNGVLGGSITTSNNLTSTTNYIGTYYNANNYYWPGYISNLRAVKGTALYTAAFTPPTAPLTAISGTSLLTCQSNRFRDNSSNAFAITVNGSPSVQRFSPFSPTTYYAPDAVGGSGYFDGSGDYLTTPSNAAFGFGTGDFTIECWIWAASAFNPSLIKRVFFFSDDRNNVDMDTSGNLEYYDGSVRNLGVCPLRAWTHVAISKTSGTVSAYVNGTRTYTGAESTNTSARTFTVGAKNTGAEPWDGYIADVRILKGQGLYSGTTITVPTAPLTAITNTSLLLSGTNAAIIDNAMMNNLETVGNAQTSTTQSKWGGSSMYFDGTGDWLVSPPSPNWDFGSGDFTIEFWLNPSSRTTIDAIVSKGNLTSVGNEVWTLQWYSTNLLAFFSGGGLGTPVVSNTTQLSTGTWYHVAVTRASGTTRIFINGVLEGSSATSYTITAGGSFYVGTGWYDPATRDMSGYIDDLRITKGYARYTATFTPPAGPFTPN